MSDPFSRKLEHAYVGELEEIVADHELACQVLAQDWTSAQEESGIAVPRYLELFEQEVAQSLQQTSTDIRVTQFATFASDYQMMKYDKLTSEMLKEKDLKQIRRLYENRDSEGRGIPAVIYIRSLLDSLMLKKPEAAIDKIAEVASWNIPNRDRLVPIMHAAIDTTVYQRARHIRGIDHANELIAYASSESVQFAMSSALDLRVLRYAKRMNTASSEEDATPDAQTRSEFIRHYASSDLAALALIECLEGVRSMSRVPYSKKAYIPRVTPKTRELLRLRRREAYLKKRHKVAREAHEIVERDSDFLRIELTKAAKYALEFLGYDISDQEIHDKLHPTAHLIIFDQHADDILY